MVTFSRRVTGTRLCAGFALLFVATSFWVSNGAQAAEGTITQFRTVRVATPNTVGAPQTVNRTYYNYNAEWTTPNCAARLTSTWKVESQYSGTSAPGGSHTAVGILQGDNITYKAGSEGWFDTFTYSSGYYDGRLDLVDASNGSKIVELARKTSAAPGP